MKNFTKMKKEKGSNYYTYFKGNSRELGMLRSFLSEDLAFGQTDLFKSWTYDHSSEEIGSNNFSLEKEGELVILECDWFMDEPNPPQLKMTIENFRLILDKWCELLKKQPEYITIKKENGHIFLEGV